MSEQELDNLFSKSYQLLKELIAIPSFSKEEDKTALHLETFFKTNQIF